MRSCAQLSTVLGLQKSFSTNDITQLPNARIISGGGGAFSLSQAFADLQSSNAAHLRQTISELALNSLQLGFMLDSSRLDHTSRSCSTWVAVGELASTSQLPSPHGGPITTNANTSSSQQQLTAANANISSQPTFTTIDLMLSVNKSVRRNYIRRRLLTTYRAIERLSQSEFNLNSMELEAAAVAAMVGVGAAAAAAAAAADPGPTELKVPSATVSTITPPIDIVSVKPIGVDGVAAVICPQLTNTIPMNDRNLTIQDIEKERGRPLSKYDRNMMIFNWLHSLDETSTVEEYNIM